MTEPTVLADGLVLRFPGAGAGEAPALNDFSLRVRPGELTALVGPDGAGKTTFMRCCAGLLKPQQGRLSVLGQDVLQAPQAVQDRISYMPQRFGLYEDLSVQENLDLYADLHGVPPQARRERFARMLEMTDMSRFTDRPAGKLSGGMKQKLGLACTLVRSPELLLLDEPSVGVDPLSRRDLWKIIMQLVEDEGLSVLVSTAYMDEAERCAQVCIMHAGQILARGTPAEIRSRARGLTYRCTPPAHMQARDLQARLIDAPGEVIDAEPRGGDVRFILRPGRTEDRAQVLARLLPDMQPQTRPEDLEDAFMMLLRHAGDTPPEVDVTPGQGHPAVAAARPGGQDRGPAISVRDLVRRFGDFTAVASTSFEVARGEIFGLLGPNGAGKTTTFRMLCGLLPATSGELNVAGQNLREARARARASIGYVSQKFALYGNLTVSENLRFLGGAYGLRGRRLKARMATLLDQFDLDPSARSGQLPAGYRQRLAMAGALLHEPQILFLDEPTSGIDPLARRAFWRSITELARGGVTVVITTHFMEEAEYCDRVAIQDAGKMLAIGTPREVRDMAGAEDSDMTQAFIGIVEQSRAKRPGSHAGEAA
ncbi:ATP-binding cassette domain-containing protein [Pseudooceanicola sp. C21-150M6]|uniref:ATP-binding cassette domain-containing protein n=1 Tax=Pseudooceanicola sp. C21-150M6 TaxID=3434355 RepID=UPI003D7F5A05